MNAKKVMLFTPRATRRRGQILIMTLLGLTVLVGMVFYLFNVGTQVNRRVELQHAADSAAISGTAWMARSMNTVAMNNMGQVKLLTNSIILDSMPLATEMSYNELKGWDQAVLAQLGAGVPNRNSEGWLIEEALQNIHAKINQQSEILADMDRALNHSGFKMDQTTHWRVDGQDNSGHLWQAMAGLQGFSEVTVSTCGALAQSNAVRWGTSGHTDVAFLTPILPVMPASLGNFLDFAPLMVGFEQIGTTARLWTGRYSMAPGVRSPTWSIRIVWARSPVCCTGATNSTKLFQPRGCRRWARLRIMCRILRQNGFREILSRSFRETTYRGFRETAGGKQGPANLPYTPAAAAMEADIMKAERGIGRATGPHIFAGPHS